MRQIDFIISGGNIFRESYFNMELTELVEQARKHGLEIEIKISGTYQRIGICISVLVNWGRATSSDTKYTLNWDKYTFKEFETYKSDLMRKILKKCLQSIEE